MYKCVYTVAYLDNRSLFKWRFLFVLFFRKKKKKKPKKQSKKAAQKHESSDESEQEEIFCKKGKENGKKAEASQLTEVQRTLMRR